MKTQPVTFVQTKLDARTMRWVRRKAELEKRSIANWLRVFLETAMNAEANANTDVNANTNSK